MQKVAYRLKGQHYATNTFQRTTTGTSVMTGMLIYRNNSVEQSNVLIK